MSVSEIAAGAANNLDEYERLLRAGGARQASVEDTLLVELAQKLAPVRRSPHAQVVSAADPWDTGPTQPPEAATPQPTIAFALRKPSGAATLDVEAEHASAFGAPYSHDRRDASRAKGRRPRGWTFKASALAPAGAALFSAALVIAVFGPKGGPSGAPKAPPFIAAGQGPTEAPQPSGETVAARGDVDAARLKDIAPVKVARSEERPSDRDADASPAATPPAPPPAGEREPQASAGPPVAATPVAAAEIAAPPPAVGQSSDSSSVRTASAPPDATAAPAAVHAGEAAPRNAPQRPAQPAPSAGSKAVAVAQPTTPTLALPANLSRRASARAMVAKTGAISPGPAETTSQHRPGASKAPPAPAEQAATPAPAAAPDPVNPMAHAFGAMAGALFAPAADQSAWAVQFAAPKSEAEAEAAAARLNAKYAPALNGATIGVHKTVVNGETIYALRVAGLSAADAAALCVRVKGRDCSSVAK